METASMHKSHHRLSCSCEKPRRFHTTKRRGFSMSRPECGTHQELLAMDGLYRRLYELQYAEQVPLPGGDGAANGREGVAEEHEAA